VEQPLEEEEPKEDSNAIGDVVSLAMKKGNGKGRSIENPSSDPVLIPNINSSAVRAKEQEMRAAQAKAAKARKDRDKNDLTKQRADQAKRKEEARQRAARGERRA